MIIASYDMVHGMCGSNGHGLTIHVSFMVKCVRYVRAVDPLVL
jgi:hypothetical protein